MYTMLVNGIISTGLAAVFMASKLAVNLNPTFLGHPVQVIISLLSLSMMEATKCVSTKTL